MSSPEIVPLLAAAVIVLAYLGFVGVTVRVGLWLRRQKGEGGAGMTYASGLLGLLLVKGPALLGLLLTLLAAAPFPAIGRFLFAVGTIEMAAAALYGFGGTLQYLRVSSGPR